MCTANVTPAAEPLLADIMWDLCAALDPADPASVVIGPVDFGAPHHVVTPAEAAPHSSSYPGPEEGG